MLNILHLPHRLDRLKLLEQQLEEQGITEYKLWDGKLGIAMRERKMNIVEGHKQIVRDAKEKGLPYVIIAEDDITFFGKGAWKYYIENMPQSFDMYLGMFYTMNPNATEGLRITGEVCGFTLYTVHERFYDVFLAAPIDKHIDRSIMNLALNHEFYVPEYFVCHQNATQSDNTMGKPDLMRFLKGRKLFSDL